MRRVGSPVLGSSRGSDQNRRRRSHAAADEDRLPGCDQRGRKVGVSDAKGPRRTLAVNEQPPLAAIDFVRLLLARVVRHVEHKVERSPWEELGERGPRHVREYLAVG